MKVIFTKGVSKVFLIIFAFVFGVIVYAAADGFDFPVGPPDGEGYNNNAGWGFLECTDPINGYDCPNPFAYHPGEDWNGDGGGDTDLGDPVYAVADGLVLAADNYCAGWGNIVLIEHTLNDDNKVWTQYAHLKDISTSVGSFVKRGDLIGTIGKGCNNEYLAHLHFEIRHQYREPDDWVIDWDENEILEHYHEPTVFINNNRPGGDDPLPVINVSGTISEDTTWEAGYVYLIQGSVTVVENVTLTLEPGVIVKFQNTSSRFNIYGNLYAQGTQQNKIYFTSYKDDTVGGDSNGDGNNSSPAPSNWRQITVFENGSADLSHAVLRYGGYTCAYCGINPGGLLVDGGQLTLADTLIEKNNYGIYFKNITGTTSISNSTISDNTSYGIFSTGGNHDIYLSNSTISNHSNTGIYASASATTTVSLLNNTFQNNQTRDGYFSISNINFINQGNTTSGTGGNGFHISGTLLGNQIWNPGVPYIISTVTLPADTTLTINPNTIVKFQNTSSRFNIYGNLYAQGTQQNKIYFTSYKDDTVGGDSNGDGNNSSPAPSNWRQITVFENGSADLSHAVLRYGGYTCAYCGINPGGLLVDGGQLTLADTLIEKNNYGIYRRTSGNVSVTQSSIKENTSYGIYHTGTGTTTATSNWWGDASGPYHPQNNPNGQGDRVSNNVEFSSWLIEDPFWKQFIFPKK